MTSQKFLIEHGLYIEAVFYQDMVEYHVKTKRDRIIANIFEDSIRYFEYNVSGKTIPYLYRVAEAIKDGDFGRIITL